MKQIQNIGLIESHNEEETEAIGKRLGHVCKPGHVIGLVGDLGASKTCFVRGVTMGCDVDPTVYVASPTFTIVHEYPGRLPIYHIDLYRLSDSDELIEIGLDEYYRSDGISLVEWFDRFPELAPAYFLELRFEITGDTSRQIIAHARGEDHIRLAEECLMSLK